MGNNPSSSSSSSSSSTPSTSSTSSSSSSYTYTSQSKAEEGIITVNSGDQNKEKEEPIPELKELQHLKEFLPIIPESSDIKWVLKKPKTSRNLDPLASLTICSEVQRFFRLASRNVTENQKRLEWKMGQMEGAVQQAHSKLGLHFTDAKHFELQFREVERIGKVLREINTTLESIVQQADRLVLLLPEEDSMELLSSLARKNRQQQRAANQSLKEKRKKKKEEEEVTVVVKEVEVEQQQQQQQNKEEGNE